MDFSVSSLVANLVVGTVGFSIFLYGKKQQRIPQLAAGLVLMVFPYFVTDATEVYAIGAAVVVAMWLGVRQGF